MQSADTTLKADDYSQGFRHTACHKYVFMALRRCVQGRGMMDGLQCCVGMRDNGALVSVGVR
jgi:hypothetical protein